MEAIGVGGEEPKKKEEIKEEKDGSEYEGGGREIEKVQCLQSRNSNTDNCRMT